jgi:hypothetical protein
MQGRCESLQQLRVWLTGEPGALEKLGSQEVESGNPYLGQFKLPAPVEAFGHQTNIVVFTSSGPMAVLDDLSPQALADKLGVTPSLQRRQIPWRSRDRGKERGRNRRDLEDADRPQCLDRRIASR